MSNRKIIFIAKLWRETHLDHRQVETLVNDISDKYLDEAIKIYKEYGVFELINFVKELEAKANLSKAV